MRSTEKIDGLNILLIFLSGVLAYYFPLEVFILSYAILGPLHYLTEINWLNSNNYFTSSKRKLWLTIGLLTSILVIAPRLLIQLFEFDNASFMFGLLLKLRFWSNGIVFTSILLAVGAQFIKKSFQWIILIGIGLTSSYFLNKMPLFSMFVGVFVPTILHVYVFTLFFMVYGARKSKSKLGYFSVLSAILVPLVFCLINIDVSLYSFQNGFKSAFLSNNLQSIPLYLSKSLGLSNETTFTFYKEPELRLLMFISFIYLYHYLNWFTKTTTIFWHKSLTVKRSIIIGLLWALLLVFFYIDFSLGFMVALFLSFLHVVLEFPLNVISIKSLFRKV